MEGPNILKLKEFFKGGKEKAQQLAQKIAEAGELRIDVDTISQYVGYVSFQVCSHSSTQKWWVNIRPVHFGGYDSKVFDFKQLRYITFEYRAQGVTKRHSHDPSTYLKIKDVR